MPPSLAHIFAQEMLALREAGSAFASDFPEAAGFLDATKVADPGSSDPVELALSEMIYYANGARYPICVGRPPRQS